MADERNLNIELQRTPDGFHLVRCAGELRSEHGPLLLDQVQSLVAEPGAVVIIDLSQLRWLDSSGLGHLISLGTRARLSEARLILVGPTPFVAGVLEMTQLDRWFEIVPDLDEARQRLAKP